METYFFVPGTRLHKIPEIQKLKISQLIVDLEDAVKFSEREKIVIQLQTNPLYKNFYIRIPLYDETQKLNTSFFRELYQDGFRKFIFPKVQNSSDFNFILSEESYSDIQIIVLIETTRFFLEVKDVLDMYKNQVSGIGLGSHDFMAEVGGIHNLQNLEYVRQQILYLARMVNITAIDIASMELIDERKLEQEIQDGLNKGYDAKFFIHPWQISIFNSIPLYTKSELQWAKNVMIELDKVGLVEEFNPIVIDGQIIERPHLLKAKKILNYYESK